MTEQVDDKSSADATKDEDVPLELEQNLQEEAEEADLVEEDDDATEEAAVFFHNLSILPPLQKNATPTSTVIKDAVVLPPIQATEPVSSIRAALSELRGYAHFTNFRLVLENSDVASAVVNAVRTNQKGSSSSFAAASPTDTSSLQNTKQTSTSSSTGGKKKKKKKGTNTQTNNNGNTQPNGNSHQKNNVIFTTPSSQVVSPYAGKDAVISVPAAMKSLENDPIKPTLSSDENELVLDDYGDLTLLTSKGMASNQSAFRMVLERYDLGSLSDHVIRLRALFDGNAPSVESLIDVNSNSSADDNNGADGGVASDGEFGVAEQGEVATSKCSDKEGDEDGGKSEVGDKQKNEIDSTGRNPKKAIDPAEMILPSFPLDKPIAIDGKNLANHFYLACGEEDALALFNGEHKIQEDKGSSNKELSNKSDEITKEKSTMDTEVLARETANKLSELEERCRVKCSIAFGGFNPPPSHRRLLGDLAYLEVALPGDESVVHVTAIPTGFYINRTTGSSNTSGGGHGDDTYRFDPTPAADPCFSHSLLDCLLLKSKALRAAWADALGASKERAELSVSCAATDTPIQGLFRAVTRGDNNNGSLFTTTTAQQIVDSVTLRPSWLVPLPRKSGSKNQNGKYWVDQMCYDHNTARAEDELSNAFGLDIKGGAARDWNEELQSAREMSTETLQERVDRARLVHKTLSDFGDASVAGAKAIFDGQITPMNPNEPTRSHVYLHNNIFFSRAVDAGVDTFKISQGDMCARKSATRDADCVGTLHKLDIPGLHTLATVLVDYLGTRLVCQSIVPGILQGEKTHTILYGAVEATSPLAWDKDLHDVLEKNIGKGLMVASRKVPTMPLSKERMDFIESKRTIPAQSIIKTEEEKLRHDDLTVICGPLEIKGIKGSDQRNYCLDLTRLTPRDANWVSKLCGGTGNWETQTELNKTSKYQKLIPVSLEDDEWTTSVLRPELIRSFTSKKMHQWIDKKKKDDSTKEETQKSSQVSSEDNSETKNAVAAESESVKVPSSKINEYNEGKEVLEDEDYLKSLRMNLNVFMPHLKCIKDIDEDAFHQLQKDEELVRETSSYLWNEILPSITKDMRENSNHQAPVDGRSLTEFLHQRGVNCRYIGRLAMLAVEEESKDIQSEKDFSSGKIQKMERRMMPEYWLELLECEMVARAGKHVLDRYLTEHGASASMQPAQTIASFLSALMSTSEESAAETEVRILKQDKSGLHDEDVNALTMFDAGGNGDAIPPPIRGRGEVWKDIEKEIGRRFRYSLHLYNSKDAKLSSRALFIPLLRRICQKTGIRLVAKNYDIGSKGLCSAGTSPGGRATATYPIAPVDILDVLPIVKHAAGGSFVTCVSGAASAVSSLHILLPDAKVAFEAAQVHLHAKALPQALDLIQEATSLYQRVVDTPLHVCVSRCLDLTAVILFQAQEMELAAANAARALAVAVQIGGFDCAEAIPSHSTLCHILINSGNLASGIKHLRASIYLMELLGGPRYVELSNSYHKLGTIYHEVGSVINALRFYQEASSRKNQDRVIDGMLSKTSANILAALNQFKPAFETEKRTYSIFRCTLGEDHELTKNSAKTLKNLMQLALEQGVRIAEEDQKRKDEEAANAVASEIEADEAAEDQKKKKRKKPKKKKST